MKKLLLASTVLLAAAVSGFVSPSQLLAQDAKKKVVIVRFKLPPDNFDSSVKAFKSQMEKKGFTEGKNIEYTDLLTTTGDKSAVAEVKPVVDANKDTADAFVTFGWIGIPVRGMLKDSTKPQIASYLLEPVAVNLIGGPIDKASGSNITAIYMLFPPDKVISALKKLKPDAKRYGIVWNSDIPADIYLKKWYDELPSGQRQGLDFVFFDLKNGLDVVKGEIKTSNVDAFGGGVALRAPANADLLKMGIPVIGAKFDLFDPEKVKATDEVFGLYNPFDLFGSQAADVLASVLGGKNVAEIIPLPVSKQLHSFVNTDAASRLKLTVPADITKDGATVVK